MIVGGIVAGLALLGVATVVLAGLIVGKQVDLEPGDRDRVVTAQHFSEMFELGLEIYPQGEVLERRSYIDGSWDLDYEYTSPDESFYISTSISNSNDEGEAKSVYTGVSVGLGVGLAAFGEGVTTQEVPGLIARGDAREAGWVMYEGERTGVYALIRQGPHVVTFLMAGYRIEPEDVRLLLAPTLDRL